MPPGRDLFWKIIYGYYSICWGILVIRWENDASRGNGLTLCCWKCKLEPEQPGNTDERIGAMGMVKSTFIAMNLDKPVKVTVAKIPDATIPPNEFAARVCNLTRRRDGREI